MSALLVFVIPHRLRYVPIAVSFQGGCRRTLLDRFQYHQRPFVVWPTRAREPSFSAADSRTTALPVHPWSERRGLFTRPTRRRADSQLPTCRCGGRRRRRKTLFAPRGGSSCQRVRPR